MLTLTRYLHSRFNAALALLVFIAGACVAYFKGYFLEFGSDNGFALSPAGEWFDTDSVSFIMSMVFNMLVIGLMVWINRRYNFIKAMTLIYVSFFVVMELSTPVLLTGLYSGIVMCAVILFCISLLFSCFSDRKPRSMRKVFLIFFLLSAGVATQYAYAGYLLVFIVGCLQMRIFCIRTVIAALLGIVTPWCLMIGSGFVHPSELHWPAFSSIFSSIDTTKTMALLVTVIFTVLMLMAGMVLTFFKILTYNARRRSYNGLIAILSAYTVVAMMADYTNLVTYIPLLNMCAAFYVSHFFAIHNSEKSYMAVISLYVIYLALFTWKIAI